MNQTIRSRIEQIKRGEIPEGYEKTPFGIFPCDWENSKQFETICFINPKTEKLPDEFIYIDLESVVKGKLVANKTISRYGAPSRAQRVLHNGDVIYQMVRPYQKNNYIFKKDIADDNIYVASTGYAQLRSNCNGFIYQLINSNYFCDQVLEKCTGTNYPAINSEDLGKVMVCYPSSQKEQEKIAEILQEQDRLIELKEKLIEEKKKRKQYLVQQLLTKKLRLPGISEEWRNITLGECLQEVNLRTTENNQYEVLSVTREGIVRQKEQFNFQRASDNNIGYKVIKKNQVAFSMLNLWMGSVDILQSPEIGMISPAYKVFDCISNIIIPDFAKYFLRSAEMVWLYNVNSEIGASIVRKNLDLDGLLQSNVTIPKIPEQRAIAEVLSKADDELDLLQKELEEQKRKKQSLMQLLLTGIVRVKA